MGATPRSCRNHCLKGFVLKKSFNQLNLTLGRIGGFPGNGHLAAPTGLKLAFSAAAMEHERDTPHRHWRRKDHAHRQTIRELLDLRVWLPKKFQRNTDERIAQRHETRQQARTSEAALLRDNPEDHEEQ